MHYHTPGDFIICHHHDQNEKPATRMWNYDRCPLFCDALLHYNLKAKMLDLGVEITSMDL